MFSGDVLSPETSRVGFISLPEVVFSVRFHRFDGGVPSVPSCDGFSVARKTSRRKFVCYLAEAVEVILVSFLCIFLSVSSLV